MTRIAPADYLTAIRYPAVFHPEQAPGWLSAIVAALGHATPPDTGGSWCEIGCGQGFGALIMAAANPGLQVTGIDISADHIAVARARADAAGLENIRFIEADIRDGADIGAQDFIVTHGVLSWVPPEVRTAIAAFTARHLAPQGIAAIQYMSEPGGAAFRAFHSVFRALAGRPDPVAEGLALLVAMRDAQAGFFQLHPHAGQTLDDLLREDPGYVAHEYLNPHFDPLAFAGVHGLFTGQGLTFAGSATPVENIDAMSIPTEAGRAIAPVRDPVLRETLKDIARNQPLRYDLYLRPGPASDAAGHLALLRHRTWQLLPGAPAATGNDLAFPTRIGPVTGDGRVFQPLLARLHRGPAAFGELEQIAPFAGRPGLLSQCLLLALGAGVAHPVRGAADPAPAARLNRVLLAAAAAGEHVPALAAPGPGSGLPLTPGAVAELAAGGGSAATRRLLALTS